MKGKRSSFLKRKACVMKKTMELSVLCDIKACAIVVDSDGTVETWPRNSTDLNPILDQYRKKHCLKKQSNNVVVDENPEEVLSKLNSKIEAVKERIELLKGKSSIDDREGEELLREIIDTSSIQEQCPIEYYWDGQIEFSDDCYVTADCVQQPYSWDIEAEYLQYPLTN